MHNHRKLQIWKQGVELTTEIYIQTKSFPKEETYGLTGQIHRSSVSISSNIAEGAGRLSDKDFKKFLGYALGSAFELETQLLIAKNLNYINNEEYQLMEKKLIAIQKMISKFRNQLNTGTTNVPGK